MVAATKRCDPETYKAGAPHARDGFLIHHGTTYPSVWSEGCIILPDAASRDTLNKYGGGTLVVKASQAPFDPGSCPDPGFGLQTDLSSQPAQEQCKGLQ